MESTPSRIAFLYAAWFRFHVQALSLKASSLRVVSNTRKLDNAHLG